MGKRKKAKKSAESGLNMIELREQRAIERYLKTWQSVLELFPDENRTEVEAFLNERFSTIEREDALYFSFPEDFGFTNGMNIEQLYKKLLDKLMWLRKNRGKDNAGYKLLPDVLYNLFDVDLVRKSLREAVGNSGDFIEKLV